MCSVVRAGAFKRKGNNWSRHQEARPTREVKATPTGAGLHVALPLQAWMANRASVSAQPAGVTRSWVKWVTMGQ